MVELSSQLNFISAPHIFFKKQPLERTYPEYNIESKDHIFQTTGNFTLISSPSLRSVAVVMVVAGGLGLMVSRRHIEASPKNESLLISTVKAALQIQNLLHILIFCSECLCGILFLCYFARVICCAVCCEYSC